MRLLPSHPPAAFPKVATILNHIGQCSLLLFMIAITHPYVFLKSKDYYFCFTIIKRAFAVYNLLSL